MRRFESSNSTLPNGPGNVPCTPLPPVAVHRLTRPVSDLLFPNAVFAWGAIILLVGLLVRIAINDFQTLTIPNRMVLPVLGIGLVVGVIRGASLGARGERVFLLSPAGAALGAVDGLLFAVAGFLLAFGVFFLLWLLGTGAGGDVKLFAAIGAWVGPGEAMRILFASVVVVAATLIVQIIRGTGTREPRVHAADEQADPAIGTKRKRIQSFALPLTISTAVVLAWDCRHALNLAAPVEHPVLPKSTAISPDSPGAASVRPTPRDSAATRPGP